MDERMEHRRKRGLPSKAKAREILHHGEVRGHELSERQRGFMGVIASGKTPTRARKRRGGKK